jgi:hypothetical protein
MKVTRTNLGPFRERPFFELPEVDRICTDELKKVGLLPQTPSPINIDLFIEKRFKITPSYDELPSGVLGCTVFGSAGVKEIIASRTLAEEGILVSERRVTTTLAHEAGHGLLHAHLFLIGGQQTSLFGNTKDVDGPKILCRGETIEGLQDRKVIRYDGRWWEYQANLAIGSLLLPRRLAEIALDPLLVQSGQIGCRVLIETGRKKAVELLSKTFDVNRIVARIRIDGLFPQAQSLQLTL